MYPWSERGLVEMRKKAEHDYKYEHKKNYRKMELYGKEFEVWDTESCGRKDCHHPMYSPLPL